MPEAYSLSSRRPQRGGSSGGLRPDLIQAGGGGKVRAGTIPTTAGNISYQGVKPPQGVENQLSSSVNQFMGVTANAAFRYQEREAIFLANEAGLAYQEAARKAYNGHEDPGGTFVPGLSQSKGALSIQAYAAFEAKLSNDFDDIIKDLEPRVKQRAILQMQSSKNQYLSKGATHRATQLAKAEEQQRYRKQSEVVATIAADPSLLVPDTTGALPIDAITQDNIKQRFYSNFNLQSEADAAWFKTIEDVGSKIYLEQGVGPARAYYENVAINELQGMGTDTLVAFGSRVMRWEHQAVTAFNSSKTLELKLKDRKEKAIQAATAAEFISRVGTPNQPSSQELSEAISSRKLKSSTGLTLTNLLYGKANAAAEPDAILKWENRFRNATFRQDGIWEKQVDGSEKNIKYDYLDDPSIKGSSSAISRLNTYAKTLGSEQTKSAASVEDMVHKWLEPLTYGRGLDDTKVDKQKINASEEIRSLFADGKDAKAVIEIMENRYKPDRLRTDLTDAENPPVPVDLKTTDEYVLKNKELYDLYKRTNGRKGISLEDYRKRLRLALDYKAEFTAEATKDKENQSSE